MKAKGQPLNVVYTNVLFLSNIHRSLYIFAVSCNYPHCIVEFRLGLPITKLIRGRIDLWWRTKLFEKSCQILINAESLRLRFTEIQNLARTSLQGAFSSCHSEIFEI